MTFTQSDCWDCGAGLELTLVMIAFLWCLWAVPGVLYAIRRHASRGNLAARIVWVGTGAIQWAMFLVATLLSALWIRSPFL